MKFKSILGMAIVCLAATMSSCSNEEEVKNPVQPGTVDLSNCESVNLSIGLPVDEPKTRAGESAEPTFTYGTDGLFTFSRTINKLWYAVYHNGKHIYNSMQPGIPQARYKEDSESFVLDIQIPKINGQVKLSEYSVFFLAGNSLDKVVENQHISDGIGLDFENKTMYADPAFLNTTTVNGEMYNPQQFDYFAKYTTLDKLVGGGENKGEATLIRPFCQVSLLTDELCQPMVLNALSTNGKVRIDTTPYISSQKIASSANTLSYGWNYGTDEILTLDASELAFVLYSRAFDNSTNAYGNTIPQEVTFKDRKMFCCASYLMLAPSTKKAYDNKAQKAQFGFNLSINGNAGSTTATALADMPSASLRANEKYIIYNKHYNTGDRDEDGDGNPDDPDGGDGGIFTEHYALDIVVDPVWSGSNESEY